jgi:hypothetical protein
MNLAKYAEIEESLQFDRSAVCDLPAARADTFAYQYAETRNAAIRDPVFGELNRSEAYDTMLNVYTATSNRIDPTNGLAPLSGPEPVPVDAELSAREMEEFGKIFADTVLDANSYMVDLRSVEIPPTAMTQLDTRLSRVFKEYYKAYINGNFIDRFGVQLEKPEIKTSIGNDVISAALLVFLEAVADLKLKTPVFFKDEGGEKIYFPSGKGEPPSAVVIEIDEETVVKLIEVSHDSSTCGVTEKEAKAIAFVANLAGDQSATLSKLVLEAFGDVQVAFVVGGHFSVGDNETLATLVTTFFETVSRRGTERLAYEFFWQSPYRDPNQQQGAAEMRTHDSLVGVTDFVLGF